MRGGADITLTPSSYTNIHALHKKARVAEPDVESKELITRGMHAVNKLPKVFTCNMPLTQDIGSVVDCEELMKATDGLVSRLHSMWG